MSRVLNMPEFWIYSGNNFKIETLKNKICSTCLWPETWILFLALNYIHFVPLFGKSLRDNAPPTILYSSTPIFPPISPTLFGNIVWHTCYHINDLTHTVTQTMSPLLPCHSRQPSNQVTQVTKISMSTK